MKKQFLLLIGAVFTATTLFAQQVPNGGFETWTAATKPDSGWTTLADVAGIPTPPVSSLATKDATDFQFGAASVKLTTTDLSGLNPAFHAIPGLTGLGTDFGQYANFNGLYFPFQRPDTLFFSYKYVPQIPQDTASVTIGFYINGSPEIAQLNLPAQAAWVNLYVPLSSAGFTAGVVDSIYLEFQSSNDTTLSRVGSTLWVDGVSLGYTPVPTVNISVSPTTVAEGGVAKFVATLSSPATAALSININNAGSTADTPDDFVPSKTAFDFAVGETTDTITVTTLTDALTEGDEVLTITAAPGAGYTVGSSATLTITDVVSGIHESAAMKAIRLYPNPATTNVNVVVPAEVATQNVTITDISGKVIVSENNVSGTKAINVSNLANGNYIVTFTDATTKAFTGAKQLQVTK